MITPDELLGALQDASACHSTPDGLLVATDCLYPSNSVVQVAVYGTRRFTVSDRGAAVGVLSSHGVNLQNPSKSVGPFAASYGLKVGNSGTIMIEDVAFELLPLAIVSVANASKEAAFLLLEKHRFALDSDFREQVRESLHGSFPSIVSDSYNILGASNKPHIFDHALIKSENFIVLLDSVVEDPNSINSVVVSNLDVGLRREPRFTQRIVFDNTTDWRSENLLLLEEVAPVVKFTNLIDEIEQIISKDYKAF